jgi:ectoine hydroxylase-related dioxygenase (phytanoyl-CoA dioxygenase family)
MIKRIFGSLELRHEEAPAASVQLEQHGYAVLREVLDPMEVGALATDVARVFDEFPADRGRTAEQYRYEMLNRSALAQAAIGHQQILAVIEPLLGDDCHVIANTAWRNPPEFAGGPWHTDAGPHVPRPEGVPWDDRIPYPVFAIGAHIYLQDCLEHDGPTAVVPGSHRSGRHAPYDRVNEPDLTYDGRGPVLMTARAGDVALFVSDVWHRGTPACPGGRGRFFLQAHYGRRDIAQRLHESERAHQLSPEAVARASTPRQKTLVGLHTPFFYDG